jgi:colanic acid/amylovoran biosynthesis glycosyltransferase
MKVTFCAYDWPRGVGGPGTWLRRLLPELEKEGVDSEVLVFHAGREAECPLLVWLKQRRFRHRAVWLDMWTDERVRWLLEQIAARPPDVFVPNVSIAAYLAGCWIRQAGIPTVGVLHSDDEYHRAILDRFVTEDGPFQVSAVVCVSRFLDELATTCSKGVTVWRAPYGVPVPEQAAVPPREVLRLVYVGRLVEQQKRISRVAEWFCKAVADVPGVEAVLIGDGQDRAAVEAIIGRWRRGLPVEVSGWSDSEAVEAKIRQAHAIVLLSDYEGLPISMLEGMASGLVPIATRIRSGVPELIEDGVTGLLVDDEASFVEAVASLRSDVTYWATLSRHARQHVQVGYSVEAMAAAWLELLRRLVDGTGVRRSVNVPVAFDLPPPLPELRMDDARCRGALHWVTSKSRRAVRRIIRGGARRGGATTLS